MDRRRSPLPRRPLLNRCHLPRKDLVPARGLIRLGIRVLAPDTEPQRERGQCHRNLHDRGGGTAESHQDDPRQLQRVLQHGRRHRGQGRLHQGGERRPGHRREGDVPKQPQIWTRLHRNNLPRPILLPGRGHHRLGVHHLRAHTEPEPNRHRGGCHLHDELGACPPGHLHHTGRLAQDDKGERRSPRHRPLHQGNRKPADHRREGDVLGQRNRGGVPRLHRDGIPSHHLLPPRRGDGRRLRDLHPCSEPKRHRCRGGDLLPYRGRHREPDVHRDDSGKLPHDLLNGGQGDKRESVRHGHVQDPW